MGEPSGRARGMMLAAAASIALVVAGGLYWAISARNAQVDSAPSDTLAAAEQVYTDFLAANGQDFEACFPPFDPNEKASVLGNGQKYYRNWTSAILLVDASGSMAERADGKVKMVAAKEAAAALAAVLPKDRSLGLMVFGHRGNSKEAGKAASCEATELLLSPVDYTQEAFLDHVQKLSPVGWSPLANAISRAGEAFVPSKQAGRQAVFIITDGTDSCGGSASAMAEQLRQSSSKAVVNVIGFGIAPENEVALARIAEAGGGKFAQATNAEELKSHLLEQAGLKSKTEAEADHSESKTETNETQAAHHDSALNTRIYKAKTDAGLCVNQARANETKLMTSISNNLRTTKAATPETLQLFREKMDARHREIITRLEGYRETLNSYVVTPAKAAANVIEAQEKDQAAEPAA